MIIDVVVIEGEEATRIILDVWDSLTTFELWEPLCGYLPEYRIEMVYWIPKARERAESRIYAN